MNIVESVRELFGLVVREEVENRPLVAFAPQLPQREWVPAGGDLIVPPGQRIERVIERVRVDGNVKVFERETIYINEPQARQDEPYQVVTVRQNHPPTPEQQRILADWQAGKCVWVGGTRHPVDIIRNGSAVPGSQVRTNNGRIVLQE